MLAVFRTVAGLLGFSSLKLGLILATVLGGLVLLTGVSAKIYLAGKHAAELRQAQATAAAIQRSLIANAQQARKDATAAQADAERIRNLVNELEDRTEPCLPADIVERLHGIVGK